ncbi:MAG: SPOR domain-containing protein [Novosphingobium sp.]|nr:SPOR domain-containing protein [Novosphingobium sp.]
MYSNRESRKSVRYAVCTALAASLLAGCAGANPFAKASSAGAVAAKADYSTDKQLAKVEKRVAEAPRDASLRAELASAYLGAGRFNSAVTTFEDAIALGDSSARTALSLSLAFVGSGRNADALQLLEKSRDAIPASDFGLAIALAGDTSRGVTILSDQLRGGNVDAKLRQNLAYAYALDGRWREARVMAAQDLPADQLDARISEWAMQGRPEDYQKRVAGLLSAPVRSDPGQPQALAFTSTGVSDAPMMAVETSEPVSADAELPAVASGASFWGVEPDEPSSLLPSVETPAVAMSNPVSSVEPQPVTQAPVAIAKSEPVAAPVSGQFDEAFAAPAPSTRYVSKPVIQPTKARRAAVTPSAQAKAVTGSSHMVQLGSFSSIKNAKRAWEIYQRRYPALKDQNMRITEAMVRGKKYWRVAAAGYSSGSARSMCSTVRGRGFGCIAYSVRRPLPGALPKTSGSGQMRARR